MTLAGKNSRRLLIISLVIDHIKFCLFLGKQRSVLRSSETGALWLPWSGRVFVSSELLCAHSDTTQTQGSRPPGLLSGFWVHLCTSVEKCHCDEPAALCLSCPCEHPVIPAKPGDPMASYPKAGTAQPIVCVELHFGFGPFFNHLAWDTGKCSCCTHNPSLGNHFICTAKCPEWVKPSHPWDVQQELWMQGKDPQLLLLPAHGKAGWAEGRTFPPEQVICLTRGSHWSIGLSWALRAFPAAPVLSGHDFPGWLRQLSPSSCRRGGLACTALGWPGGFLSDGLGAPVGRFSWSLLWTGINPQIINKGFGFRPF